MSDFWLEQLLLSHRDRLISRELSVPANMAKTRSHHEFQPTSAISECLLTCRLIGSAQDLSHRLLQEALKLLPRESSFPFDSSHLVVIEHYADFIKARPELQARPDLQKSGRELYAFTISQCWPIYFNFDGHEILIQLYTRPGGQWVPYLVAAVLTHEAVHARGDPKESAALSEELKLDRFFYSHKKLPLQFDLARLAEQYQAALEEERGVSSPSRTKVILIDAISVF